MKKRALQSVILGVSIGAAVGLGACTFIYANYRQLPRADSD